METQDYSSLPKMTVDQARYDEMRQSGFDRFPERYENFVKLQEHKREVLMESLPGILYIEPMGRCNFQCPMCDLQILPNRRSGEMTFDDFKKIVDPLIGVYEVKMPGIGEVLLHRDVADMVKYLGDRDIWLHLATNGSLLDKRDNYKRIIDGGVGELTLSVDGATQEVFETVRPGALMTKLTKNFKLVNDYCNNQNLTRTRSFTTVQKTTRHQLLEIIDYVAECGFKRHTFEFGLFDWGNEDMKDTIEALRDHAPLDIQEAWSLIDHGKKLGVDVTFLFLEQWLDLQNVCGHPFERMFVGSTMRIGPCTHIGYRGRDLGDGTDVIAAWNDEKYRNFRKAHIDGDIPQECKFCYGMN